MKNKNEEGFTLIETLITLFITSVFFLMPILAFDQVIENMKVALFFRELSSNITLMQNHAILSGKKTVIEFVPQENIIRFKEYDVDESANHPINRELYLEEGIYELQSPSYRQIIFHGETGNIAVSNHRWRTAFITGNGSYELVFQLGSGRFDIRKR